MVSWRLRDRCKRLLRFRLRSLMVMVAFAAVLLGWWSDRRRLEERIAQRDDLLSVLRASSPEYLAGDVEVMYAPGEFLYFDSAEKLLKSLRDDRTWTGADGKCPKVLFRPEDVGRKAVPLLLPLLKDADVRVRNRVAYVLRCVGPLSPTVAPALLAAAHDESPEVRFEAIWAINEIDGQVEGLAADLAAHLDGDRPKELDAIITAIRKHDRAYDLNPQLVSLLTHEDPKARAMAATSFQVGPATTREGVSKLLAMLDDADMECRIAAAEALCGLAANGGPVDRQVRTDEVVDRLVRAFKSEAEPRVRRAIARSVASLHRETGE